MKGDPTCPRCGAPVRPPGIWSSAWECPLHGAVPPLQPVAVPTTEVVHAAVREARVPLWLPWPLPPGWLVTGVRTAGDERSGARATAVACSGPNPLGGAGELVIVAEEPGVGLGARFAGLDGPDPGAGFDEPAPHAKVVAAGHPAPLWSIPAGADEAVYVGEAGGMWLWAVLWPQTAGALLLEDLALVDLRDAGHDLDLPFGALSPRLAG